MTEAEGRTIAHPVGSNDNHDDECADECGHVDTQRRYQQAYDVLYRRYANHKEVADATIQQDIRWFQRMANEEPCVFDHTNDGFTLFDLAICFTAPIGIIRTLHRIQPRAVRRRNQWQESTLIVLLKYNIPRSKQHRATPQYAMQQRWVLDVARFFINVHPAIVTQRDSFGRLPLHHALVEYHPQLIRVLLSPGSMAVTMLSSWQPQSNSALRCAWERRDENGSYALLQDILRTELRRLKESGTIEDTWTALCQDSHVSHLETIRLMLQGGSEKDGAGDAVLSTRFDFGDGRLPLHAVLAPRKTASTSTTQASSQSPTIQSSGDHRRNRLHRAPLVVLKAIIDADAAVLMMPEQRNGSSPAHLYLQNYMSCNSHSDNTALFYLQNMITYESLEMHNSNGLNPLQVAATQDCSLDFLFQHLCLDPVRQLTMGR